MLSDHLIAEVGDSLLCLDLDRRRPSTLLGAYNRGEDLYRTLSQRWGPAEAL